MFKQESGYIIDSVFEWNPNDKPAYASVQAIH